MATVLPRYQVIKDHLYAAIRSRQLAPGSRIPAETELAQQFGVSRMTANRAIKELEAQGLLVRHQGLGSFVADLRAESPLLAIRNIADEVRERHRVYSNELLALEAVEVDEEVAMRLGVVPGSRAYRSLMVHRQDGIPIQLEDRYVNADLLPDYLQLDFNEQTPSQYLSSRFPLSEMEHIVEAVRPGAETARLLMIDSDEPCLQVNRRTWSGERLVSCARLIHPGSRYRLSSRSRA